MRKYISLYLLIAICAILPSCKPEVPPSPPEPEEDYTPYEAPATINGSNLFKMCFFSSLADQKLFSTSGTSDIKTYIANFSGQKPILYLMERSDFSLGQSIDHLDIALATKYSSFFAPFEDNSKDYVKGTGMLTKYTVSDFDGIVNDSLMISGCTFAFPVSKTITITTYTSRINSLSQIESLIANRSEQLQTNALVIGSIKNSISTEVETYLKKNFESYRLLFFGESSGSYDLFVLCPVDFVCRSIDKNKVANTPYYMISLELLSTANL